MNDTKMSDAAAAVPVVDNATRFAAMTLVVEWDENASSGLAPLDRFRDTTEALAQAIEYLRAFTGLRRPARADELDGGA